MKDVLCLATFTVGALCFVAFVTTVRPIAVSAVAAPNVPEYCKIQVLGAHGCRANVFAAVGSR
jgi:hypothetical protein